MSSRGECCRGAKRRSRRSRAARPVHGLRQCGAARSRGSGGAGKGEEAAGRDPRHSEKVRQERHFKGHELRGCTITRERNRQIGGHRAGEATLHLNGGTEKPFDEMPANRLEPEFRAFSREIASGDRTFCYEMLEHSLAVSKVQTKARLDAGIIFPADSE